MIKCRKSEVRRLKQALLDGINDRLLESCIQTCCAREWDDAQNCGSDGRVGLFTVNRAATCSMTSGVKALKPNPSGGRSVEP